MISHAILKFLDWLILFIQKLFFKETNVKDRVAVITGAGRGIGRSITEELLVRGVVAVLVDVNQSLLEQTAEELRSMFPESAIHTYVADISDANKTSGTFSRIAAEVGPIEILVNNAGVIFAHEFADLDNESIAKTIHINLMSHFWVSFVI